MTGVRAPSRQVAALPWRKRGARLEILLITSRETKRWVIPKGWPMGRKTHAAAAAQEAFEEAGVEGQVAPKPLGRFSYGKRRKSGAVETCTVAVFPLEVVRLSRTWPERGQRTRRWFSRRAAAAAVQEAELVALIVGFELDGSLGK